MRTSILLLLCMDVTADVVRVYKNFELIGNSDEQCNECLSLPSPTSEDIVDCLKRVPAMCEYAVDVEVEGQGNHICTELEEFSVQDILMDLPEPTIDSIRGSVELTLPNQIGEYCIFDVYTHDGATCSASIVDPAIDFVRFQERKTNLPLDSVKKVNVNLSLISGGAANCPGPLGPYTYTTGTSARLLLHGSAYVEPTRRPEDATSHWDDATTLSDGANISQAGATPLSTEVMSSQDEEISDDSSYSGVLPLFGISLPLCLVIYAF